MNLGLDWVGGGMLIVFILTIRTTDSMFDLSAPPPFPLWKHTLGHFFLFPTRQMNNQTELCATGKVKREMEKGTR